MNQQRIRLTPQARADLVDIWNYIAEDSMDRADQVLARLREEFTRLARNPGIGHHRPDLADARYRFWTVYSFVIAYRETDPLEILAVVHGARQLEAFLQSRITAS